LCSFAFKGLLDLQTGHLGLQVGVYDLPSISFLIASLARRFPQHVRVRLESQRAPCVELNHYPLIGFFFDLAAYII
jgi:hypothetical protein